MDRLVRIVPRNSRMYDSVLSNEPTAFCRSLKWKGMSLKQTSFFLAKPIVSFFYETYIFNEFEKEKKHSSNLA